MVAGAVPAHTQVIDVVDVRVGQSKAQNMGIGGS